MSILVRTAALQIVYHVHRLVTWLFPSTTTRVNDSVMYELARTTETMFSIRWPFVRRVSADFVQVGGLRGSSKNILRVYPVQSSGSFSPRGPFTIICWHGLPPPLPPAPKLPILSASLFCTRTSKNHDVTEELVRLAGPRHDFFGFRYPLTVVLPWLCARTGVRENAESLKLAIMRDSTFKTRTFEKNEQIA